MKLSEAIEIGVQRVPIQTFRKYFDYSGAQVIAACAIGHAVLGCVDIKQAEAFIADSLNNPLDGYRTIDDTTEILNQKNGIMLCNWPSCKERKAYLGSMLTHLNDDHRMTSLQIVDWLKIRNL